jgi:tripartite-type tricarboxylate transporter receptor subunit TctC
MIVPSTPGSPTDVIARLAGQNLSASIGQPDLVEPRPGGGLIGTKAVMTAEPDGYTPLFTEGAKSSQEFTRVQVSKAIEPSVTSPQEPP